MGHMVLRMRLTPTVIAKFVSKATEVQGRTEPDPPRKYATLSSCTTLVADSEHYSQLAEGLDQFLACVTHSAIS